VLSAQSIIQPRILMTSVAEAVRNPPRLPDGRGLAHVDLLELVRLLAALLQARGWMMASAESCTGGLIAGACTELPGSSRWFERGFVTYSNASKVELLGVSPATMAQWGVVSEPVVAQMAQAALRRSQAQVALAVSGVAGPDGGSPDKPVGTVCLGYALGKRVLSETCYWPGERQAVRQATLRHGLGRLVELVAARPLAPPAAGG
jgi:nicotinamide-nucleotide amidase